MNSILEFSEFFKTLKKLNYLIFGSLIILIILALFSGQYSIPPIDRDEARFAQASSQMIQSGDYVNIKFQDEIRAKKPIGIYWLQAFSAKSTQAQQVARADRKIHSRWSRTRHWLCRRRFAGHSAHQIPTPWH